MAEPEKKTVTPLIVALAIVCFWMLGAGLILYLIPEWPSRAAFGEMFGAINALFAGLALAGVVYAVLLQRSELKLQREEIEATRLEQKRAALAQERSEQAFLKQLRAQHTAARLTALSSILSHYDSLAAGGTGIRKYQGLEDAESMAEEMHRLLAEIRSDETDLLKIPHE